MGLAVGEGEFPHSEEGLKANEKALKDASFFNLTAARIQASIDALTAGDMTLARRFSAMENEEYHRLLLAESSDHARDIGTLPPATHPDTAASAATVAADAPPQEPATDGNALTRGLAAFGSALAAVVVGRPAMADEAKISTETPELPASTFLTQSFGTGNIEEARRQATKYARPHASEAATIAAASTTPSPAPQKIIADPELDALIAAVSGKHTVLSKSKWRKEENIILQKALIELGYLKPETDEEKKNLAKLADGYFGDRTDKAVRDFQEANGLKDDGKVGNQETWPALVEKLKEKRDSAAAPTTELGQLEAPLPNMAQNGTSATQFIG